MAKKLTDASKDIIGTGFPVSGSEDTVWRLWPMIWQQGGSVLDKANKKALFAGPQGVKALQLLTDMALKDKSLYPDQTPDTQKMYGLFNSGKMAMIVTGPWQSPATRSARRGTGLRPRRATATPQSLTPTFYSSTTQRCLTTSERVSTRAMAPRGPGTP